MRFTRFGFEVAFVAKVFPTTAVCGDGFVELVRFFPESPVDWRTDVSSNDVCEEVEVGGCVVCEGR